MDYWTANRSLRGAVSLAQINFNRQTNHASQLTDSEHQFQIELLIEPQIVKFTQVDLCSTAAKHIDTKIRQGFEEMYQHCHQYLIQQRVEQAKVILLKADLAIRATHRLRQHRHRFTGRFF